MSPEHLIGIGVIDQQHQEIDEISSSAIEAIQSGDKWHLVHYILIRLHELLRIHFAVEEGLMQIIEYPEIESHQKLHRDYLAEAQELREATLRNDASTDTALGKHSISFLSHILDHDKKFAEYIRANITFFKK